MSETGSERGAGSEFDDDEAGFDPSDLANMSEKDRKKWEKNLAKWRIFMDFLVRHIAISTFKYNCFEKDDLQSFMIALEKAEAVRMTMKLKKGEEARLGSFKAMKDASDLLTQRKYLAEGNSIKRFLDLGGRLRGLSLIATGFFKALKKGKVPALEKLKHYLDYWKGFTVRSFDYADLQFKGTDPDRFSELEKKYMVWPTVIRTALNLAQKFLKRASDSTGLDLIPSDPKVIQQHMQAAEFVVAARLEEMMVQKVVQESKSFVLGANILNATSKPAVEGVKSEKYDISLDDISEELIKPISDTGMLLNLPPDPPKEKKGKKGKGKKGSAKSSKGRGTSASSHRKKKR